MRMRKNYEDNNLVIIPEVYLYSNNILIMSYEEGEHIDDIQISDYNKPMFDLLSQKLC